MAHTDRDDARWFWHDHFQWNQGNPKCADSRRMTDVCWCKRMPGARQWINPYRYETGVPSEWHRDQRKSERGRARTLMQRARSGHVDWDDLVIAYRRPYYW